MNVFDAALERIRDTFAHFDNIIVAFSGGKDSGVMLELTVKVARELGRRFTVFHLDYEGQYTATTEYVTRRLSQDRDIFDVVWTCLPFSVPSAVSMYDNHWTPWNKNERDLWVRDLPTVDGVIHENNAPDWLPDYQGVWDYTFQANLSRAHHTHVGADNTAVLVGIRSQESLHRYAALNRDSNNTRYQGWKHSTRIFPNVYNIYPLWDWLTEDIWTANARNGWDYNKLYDLFYQAGLTIHDMRVASPFISTATHSLKIYRIVEPTMWARLVGRVNGANFTAIYGGTNATGWKDITLPPGHTWKTYCEFLLSTLPEHTRENYLRKFSSSITYWTDKGGALKVDLVNELKNTYNTLFEDLGEPTDNRKRNEPYRLIRFHNYPDDLDSSDYTAVPTYKRMCITILKNDHACKTMGFGQTKAELEKRRNAIAKFKEII